MAMYCKLQQFESVIQQYTAFQIDIFLAAHFLAVFCFAVVNVVSCGVIELRNEPTCLPGDDYFSAGPECYNFYSCRNGVLEIIECPGGLLWNDDIKRCDAAENVQCEVNNMNNNT